MPQRRSSPCRDNKEMLPARRTTESLCELGYRVLEAASGTAALEALRNDSDIDLLFTDVVILKNTFANNAFENFEIAAYKSLLALCGPAGADNARAHLEASLREEEQMAQWVADNVEKVTLAYVAREARAAA